MAIVIFKEVGSIILSCQFCPEKGIDREYLSTVLINSHLGSLKGLNEIMTIRGLTQCSNISGLCPKMPAASSNVNNQKYLPALTNVLCVCVCMCVWCDRKIEGKTN